MIANNKKVELRENIAAIRVDTRSNDNAAQGVAVIIPMGEVVELDEEVATFSGGMEGVIWNGTTHAIFREDLLQRTKKTTQEDSVVAGPSRRPRTRKDQIAVTRCAVAR